MLKLIKIKYLILISSAFFLLSNEVYSAGGETYDLIKPGFSFEGPTGTYDRAQLRRGYQVYKEVCASCHSMKQLSFRNLSQKGGPEYTEDDAKVFASEYTVIDGFDDYGDPVERARILSDRFPDPYNSKEAAKASNNGAYPPDLSLLTKAMKNGPDYIYSLLTGYEDPPNDFELTEGLYYNPYHDGKVIAMPPPLYDDAIEYIDGTNASLHQLSYDTVNFLNWAAEPELEKRKSMGIKVILFLIVLTALLYVTMKETWSRIEK